MLKEARERIQHSVASEVRDAGIITTLLHMIHYKIAGYAAICSYATALKLANVAGKSGRGEKDRQPTGYFG